MMTDTISQGVFQEFIAITGNVMPIKTILIDAVEGGKVEQKFVEDGAMVKKGQTLLQLSNPDLLLNSLNQEANVIAQINQLRNTSLLMEQQSLNLKEQAINIDYQIDLTQKRLARNEKLFQNGVISKVEIDEMKAEFKNLKRRRALILQTITKDSTYQDLQQQQMESSLSLMERNLKITQQTLESLIIKSPIDGQISGLNLEIGELVSKGSNIATLDKLDNFKIQLAVDEFYIARVFQNQIGRLDYNGTTYPMAIQKIYPQVTGGTFLVDMIFTNDIPTGIRRGQTVNVKLELSAQKESKLIARGAFYQNTNGHWVYVIDPTSGNAHKRAIELGNRNPNYYEVIGGLEDGEVVITSSYDTYGDRDVLLLD